MGNNFRSDKLALLVGGGPAPGINGVISAVTFEALNQGMDVLGVFDGFKWLVQGNTDRVMKLTFDDVNHIANRGGSVLRTSRVNPAKSKEDMHRVLDSLHQLGVTALVTIGGDDTAFSASQVHWHAGGAIRVAHVPKTIDNDLPLPPGVPTFGFETARHVGVEIVRNLAEDARTTSRWYIVVTMGRAAGFLALGIGKAAGAHITLIPEEFPRNSLTVEHLCDILLGTIIKRHSRGRQRGVAILAEGLLDAIGFDRLQSIMDAQPGRYGDLVRDDHGHLRLGEIDFGRMVRDYLAARLADLIADEPLAGESKPRKSKLEISFIDKEVGYELRSADPIPFDVDYTRDLGYGAVKFLLSPAAKKFGAIISVVGGVMKPLPFADLINPETGRMQPRKVDIKGEAFEVARRYMMRLERDDFQEPQLSQLAAVAGLSPERFRDRFGYVVGL
jgi:6-phosphofructokinase 1